MPITLDGTNGITTPTYGGADTSEYLVPVTAFKNRIINGAMVIDQRNAGASVSSSGNGVYTLDRWDNQNNSGGTRFSVQQNAGSVTPPAGFTNYLGVTSTSAYSVTSTDVIAIRQKIEGYNVADLNWGSANAKTVTLSFWVRSSLTGTFGCSFGNNNGNRFYPITYTINSANTWEQKTITVAGDTSGTWNTTNLTGIQVFFNLGTGATFSATSGVWGSSGYAPTGATSVVGTNGATFYITGVQLEVGSTATSFDTRSYGTELQLCMRYCQLIGQAAVGREGGATYSELAVVYAVPMRASVTLTFGGFPGANNKLSVVGVGDLTMTAINGTANPYGAYLVPTISGGSAGRINMILQGNAFLASAEL